MRPRTAMPGAKTSPPSAMMKIAKAIAGIATRMRAPMREPPGGRRCDVATSPTPEAPAPRGVLLERRLEGLAGEVGPQLALEDQLGVRRLPQQVVRHPLLAACADDEVRVVHLGGVEQRPERLLPTAVVPLRGVEDLRPPAVVEGHEERDAVVGRSLALGPLHVLEQGGRDPVAAADEAHPHALLLELGRLGQNALGEHPHQGGDLLQRPRPVLGGERVDGQLADAEVGRVAQARLDDVGSGAVPLLDREPAGLRPAAVAVRDDRDVPRGAGVVPLRRGVGHHTSRISASLCLSSASSSWTRSSVSFWSSTSARCSSSAPTSPSSLSSRRSCMMSRRTLRMATRPSSAMWRTTLTSSRRRSSLSSGTPRRIRRPSLFGVRPMSDSMIAFSIALIELWSYGCTVSRRASGALIVASCFSGVGAP